MWRVLLLAISSAKTNFNKARRTSQAHSDTTFNHNSTEIATIKQLGGWNPDDAANAFVRVALSEVGRIIGGLSDEQWVFTREFFRGCCAYTGERLSDMEVVREHAIPINREHCGVHAFGNVLPASKAANRGKGRLHYRDYMTNIVKNKERLARIERFLAESGYADRIAPFTDLLPQYCELQYRQIVALAEASKNHLQSLVDDEKGSLASESKAQSREPAFGVGRRGTLPIKLDPAGALFKEQLVTAKEAWICTYYEDGRVEARRWNAPLMSLKSNVMGNLRSRPEHRSPRWRELGIKRLLVTIDPLFILTLEKTCYDQGFFNVPVCYDDYVGKSGSVELTFGQGVSVTGKINRNANTNGTAQILGGPRLCQWFQENYMQGDHVVVRFRSTSHISLF